MATQIRIDPLPMGGAKTRDEKAHVGPAAMDHAGRPDQRREIAVHFLRARARQQPDDRSTAMLRDEAGVEALARQLIEEWMPDVARRSHAAIVVPLLFKRQRTQNVVDEAAHLLDAPAGPTPELRRHEIEDGNAV